MLSHGDIDVALCDIKMPDGNGIDVLRQTRAAGIDTVFVMVTGELRGRDGRRGAARRRVRLHGEAGAQRGTPAPARAHRVDARPARGEPRAAQGGERPHRDALPLPVARDARRRAAGREGRADREHRADHGRERHRQGRARAIHPPEEHPQRQAVHRGELQRDSRAADGKRVLRPRQGRVHRRRQAAARSLPRRRHGNAVPRRGRRAADADADQAAARDRGQAGARHRQRAVAAGRRPHHRGDQPRSRRHGRERHVPRRPLFPAQHVPDRHSAAARQQGGHQRAGPIPDAERQRRIGRARHGDRPGGGGLSAGLSRGPATCASSTT